MKSNQAILRAALAGAIFGAAFLLSPRAFGHGDTMDGPVILAAKAALQHNEITPVLKWVNKDDEARIKAAFAKNLAVRTKGPGRASYVEGLRETAQGAEAHHEDAPAKTEPSEHQHNQ